MVLQCSKIFYFKVSSKFLRLDSQSSYSFGKNQNVGGTELSEEKFSVSLEKDLISFSYIFFLFPRFIYIYIYIYIYNIYIYIKTWNLVSFPENAILVTANVVGLYPSIPHEAGLKFLREVLDKKGQHIIPTIELIRMADFVLKNNYFEFNWQIKQQISGIAIGTKFAPPYACLFIDKIETAFLETQELQPLVWFRYMDDIFFIWTHGEQELQTFLRSLNEFHTDIKFTYESSKESIAFLYLKVSVKTVRLLQICM